MSKRQELREKRKRQERIQRLALVLGVVLVVVSIGAIIISQNNVPVGEIVSITPSASLPNANGRELGNSEATVTIEVWEDFQCPACRFFTQDVEPRLIADYVATGKAHYIFRFYPFIDGAGANSGGESDQAANASMCASEQGRFWDYHGMLFANWNNENQGAFANRRLQAFAETLGLDMTAFNKCFSANTYKDEITKDFNNGNAMGVNGTPSVFVNGVTVGEVGRIPTYEQIAQAVDAALAANP